ncbi:hypothetical protein CLV35_0156 [Motilibacter peucedani]|uniref:Integral membrane protein n=1 Tax=Motilibacter peucedani TaxID=598650 RepID=A0A420XVB3_9ACTN|nr:hypothetical protein [Motilibacter peucedani]RKS80690.1 hypothetical protein CLV35_0156 [Motilibacter peucedani]
MTPAALTNLYSARAGFAVVWAVALLAAGPDLGPLQVALLVLYPLVDAAATSLDARASRGPGVVSGLWANAALSLVTAAALAAACASGVPAVLRVWGAWAVVAGVAQLAVGARRIRGTSGQWPLVVSGAISVLAGASFVAMAGGDDPELTSVAGYAVLGGVFFLASALRLRRSAKRSGQRAMATSPATPTA